MATAITSRAPTLDCSLLFVFLSFDHVCMYSITVVQYIHCICRHFAGTSPFISELDAIVKVYLYIAAGFRLLVIHTHV